MKKILIFIFLFSLIVVSSIRLIFGYHYIDKGKMLVGNGAKSNNEINEKINNFLNTKKLENEATDFTFPVAEVVKKKSSSYLIQHSIKKIKELSDCFNRNYCGMQRRNRDDAYFDFESTPAQIYLGRYLEILWSSLEYHPEMANKIDWELIKNFNRNQNLKIKKLSYMIIKKFNKNALESETIIDRIGEETGQSKAFLLESLSEGANAREHQRILSLIDDIFYFGDPDSVIEVLENLHKMNLTKNEMIKISKSLCFFQERDKFNHNWKMIYYYINKLQVDLNLICNRY